ncbi:hypothetical protein I4P13_15760, partial [Elizabethkingia meningoseptica]
VNNIKDLQKEISSQKVINRQSYLDGYRRVEDRFSMYFDADGKMDGSHIKADTIDVGMLSSGSKSRWFQLEEVVFTPNLGSDPNSFRATAGRLVHFGIKTSSGAERVWNLSALTIKNLLNQGYYVYAKCDINGDYGTFVITPDRIVFDSQPNYYHFLIGNLYSPSNGFRIFDANYGVSQVNGRQITAGEIASVNRRLIIDLDKGEIIGKVTFTNDSPALNQVQEKIDAVQVGSVNLLDNSAVFAMSANDVGLGTSVLIENESEKFYRATPDNSKRVSLYGIWYTLESNQEYVRGIYVRHSAYVAQDVRVFNHNSNVGGEKITTVQPNTWTFIKTNTIIGSGNNSALIMEMFVPNIALDYKKTILVKGNRLGNDWMPSSNDINKEINVAKQNAANAQNAADAAVLDAISAKKILSDIANDNVVTSQEKPALLQRWKTVEAERPKLIAQAGTYNVNTDNYNNYYVALANYLTNTGVFLDMLVSTNVDGRELENNFQNYYDVRTDLNTAITNAAKSYAKGLVNNLQVGSRNLLLESNVQFSQPPGVYRIGGYMTSKLLEVGKTYTLMFKSGNGGRASVGAWVNGLQHIGINSIDGGIVTFTFTVENTGRDLNIIDFYKVPDTDLDRWSVVYWAVLIEGNKIGVQSWVPAPEDIDDKIKQNEQQTALAKAQADNALATSNITSQKVSFLSTTINNNVVATGTLEVGDVVGANAGITGVTDRGRQSVRLYAGSTYAGKNTAPWYVDDYGVEYQYLNGVMIRRRGVINGNYVDELYNISGQLAKKTAIVSGKILEEWYNNGQLVYQIGENGIYFVREIPESYTEYRMLKLIDGISSNPTSQEKDDLADFIINRTCGVNPIPGTGKFDRYNIYGDRSLFLYNAGQNVNSQSNKQYEGYKNSQNKYDNPPDGWYVNETLGWGFPGDVFLIEIIYLSSGVQVKNMAIQRDVSGRLFMECSF